MSIVNVYLLILISNQHLQELLASKEVRIPHYDFKTGKRTLNATPFRINDNQVILFFDR